MSPDVSGNIDWNNFSEVQALKGRLETADRMEWLPELIDGVRGKVEHVFERVVDVVKALYNAE